MERPKRKCDITVKREGDSDIMIWLYEDNILYVCSHWDDDFYKDRVGHLKISGSQVYYKMSSDRLWDEWDHYNEEAESPLIIKAYNQFIEKLEHILVGDDCELDEETR